MIQKSKLYILSVVLLLTYSSACTEYFSGPSEEKKLKWKKQREKKQADFDKIFSPIEFKGVIKNVEKVGCCGPKCFCFNLRFDMVETQYDSLRFAHEFCKIQGATNNHIWIRYSSGFETPYYENQLVHAWDTIIKRKEEPFFWISYRGEKNWFKAGVSIEYYEDKLPEGGKYKESHYKY